MQIPCSYIHCLLPHSMCPYYGLSTNFWSSLRHKKIDKAKLPNAKERPRSWRRAQRACSWNLPAKIKGYKKATLTLHEQLVEWCFWPMAKPNTKIEVPCANMFHSKWCQSISFYSTSTHVLGAARSHSSFGCKKTVRQQQVVWPPTSWTRTV